jgi:hypothetical protein
VEVDPELRTEILADFRTAIGAERSSQRWMEKFGEWKNAERVTNWKPDGFAEWVVDVIEPGDYAVELNYSGNGRLVWTVSCAGLRGSLPDDSWIPSMESSFHIGRSTVNKNREYLGLIAKVDTAGNCGMFCRNQLEINHLGKLIS